MRGCRLCGHPHGCLKRKKRKRKRQRKRTERRASRWIWPVSVMIKDDLIPPVVGLLPRHRGRIVVFSHHHPCPPATSFSSKRLELFCPCQNSFFYLPALTLSRVFCLQASRTLPVTNWAWTRDLLNLTSIVSPAFRSGCRAPSSDRAHRRTHTMRDSKEFPTTQEQHSPDVEEHMSVGRYIATRIPSLVPPMNPAPNPFKALTLLNKQQWMFFAVGLPRC